MQTTKTEQEFNDIYKTVQHFEEEPVYQLRFNGSDFITAEIFINDMPVVKDYEGTKKGLIFDINNYITKSGKQKARIKIYEGIKGEGLSKRTTLKVDVYKGYKSSKKGIEILNYKAPLITEEGRFGGDFKYAGQPYFEVTLEFEADVPYQLEGWSESQDLTEMDTTELKAEAEAFYEKIRKIMESRDKEKYLELILLKEKEIAQANYTTEEEHKVKAVDAGRMFSFDQLTWHPIENYKMFVHGGGKVVVLEQVGENKGESVLWCSGTITNKYGKEQNVDAGIKLFLHKPKGSNEFEIIR